MTNTPGEVTPISGPGAGTRFRTARIRAMDEHVGARIRAGRKDRGMSMPALAEAIGVSAGQIEKYEKGENACTPGRLHDIALALAINISWFFEGFAPDENKGFSTGIDVPAAQLSEEVVEIAQVIERLPAAKRRLVRDVVRSMRQEIGDAPAGGDAAANADTAAPMSAAE